MVAALFVVITGLRFWIDPDVDGVTLLYTLPVALAAIRFGPVPGLVTAALAVALYALWAELADASTGVVQFGSRAVVFALLGGGLGEYSERLQNARRGERILLEQASQAEIVSGFGSWSSDPGSGVMRWSDGLYRLFGLEPGAVQPSLQAFLELVHPDDRARVEEVALRALDGSEASIGEFRIVRPDGAERILRGVATAVTDGRGDTVSVLGTSQDVTARTIAERELRASEARYRSLIEHAPEAIVVLDVERGCFSQVNENAARLFKLSREELLRLGPAELSPPTQPDGRNSREAASAYVAEAVAGATPEFEWVHRAADGTDVTCEVRLVRLPGSEPGLVRGSVSDVGPRKRMERRLRRAEGERLVAARARDVHRVTEAALAHLSLPDLLPELVARLRQILDVDNAAVLLADDRGDLTVEAADGIEQAVVGMRIPAGQGFAGRVASRREPIALYGEDVKQTVVNPVLRDASALLGLPLIVDDHVVGVLHVGSLAERRFTDDEVSLLQLAADRAALGIQHARIYERERATAETLQRALLPDRLPDAPGLELAASYQAAGDGWDVGGDFYDAFALDDGRWVIVIGDACGKGPEAAALTALVRYTLRAEATRGRRPAALLERLNRAILQQRSDYRFCTVACAMIELDGPEALLTVSAGGHPLPLVLRAAGTVEPIGRVGDLIGIHQEVDVADVTVALGDGDTVIFYTDGLVEANAPRHVVGVEELSALITRCSSLPLFELVQKLRADAIGQGDYPPRDDVAILAFRRVAMEAAQVDGGTYAAGTNAD